MGRESSSAGTLLLELQKQNGMQGLQGPKVRALELYFWNSRSIGGTTVGVLELHLWICKGRPNSQAACKQQLIFFCSSRLCPLTAGLA